MIYLLNAIGLKPGGSSTVHIYTKNTHNNAMKQSNQKATYMKIRVHKYNNKNI